MAIGITQHDKRFHANESFDGKSPNEVLELAGLNCEALKTNRLIGIVDPNPNDEDDEGLAVSNEDNCFIIRKDTQSVIGFHTSKYNLFQNQDLADLFNYLDADVKIGNAGSFFGGKKVYMSAFTDSIGIKGTDDELNPHFLIANSFDGTLPLFMLDTSIRVWCNNSLNLALKQGKGKMRKFSHKGNLEERKAEMHRVLMLFKNNVKMFDEKINVLGAKKVDTEMLNDFFRKSFDKVYSDLGSKSEDKISSMVDDFLNDCFSTFENEMALTGSDGSLWLAANAVTKHIQHHEFEKARSNHSLQIERRAWDNVFGDNDDLSAEIMNFALEMV